MISKVILRPAAEVELQEAYEWYEERELGLGADFLECVEDCVQVIRQHPEIFPATHKGVRQGVLKRFPYSVVYFVAGESLIVVSVFHSSRDPKVWKRMI